MIGNICPEDIRKYQVTFENIPLSLEATGAFVEGLQGFELTNKPSGCLVKPPKLTHHCEVVDNSHSPVSKFVRDWMKAADPQPVVKPYVVYGVPGGAVVEYSWPCFKIKFRSLRLAQVFAKTYSIDWQIETKEAPAND